MTALLLCTAAEAIPPPAVPPAPEGAALYSDAELANTAAADLARKLFTDWARNLVEVRPTEGPAFYTKPRAEFADVCGVTRVRFGMAKPSGQSFSYIEGFVVERLYRYVDPPGSFSPSLASYGEAARAACETIPEGAKYFVAPSAMSAAFQRHLLKLAVKDAQGSSKVPFSVKCSQSLGRGCDPLAILSTVDPNAIEKIEDRPCGRGLECYEVSVGRWYLLTRTRPSVAGYTLTEPDRVLEKIEISNLPAFLE